LKLRWLLRWMKTRCVLQLLLARLHYSCAQPL
jgi:hypothetical protein